MQVKRSSALERKRRDVFLLVAQQWYCFLGVGYRADVLTEGCLLVCSSRQQSVKYWQKGLYPLKECLRAFFFFFCILEATFSCWFPLGLKSLRETDISVLTQKRGFCIDIIGLFCFSVGWYQFCCTNVFYEVCTVQFISLIT